MSNYLTDIDPIGEDLNKNTCGFCGVPCSGSYCCKDHKNADLD